jgi:hypothetical protein
MGPVFASKNRPNCAEKAQLPSSADEHFDIASLIELYGSDGDCSDKTKLLARIRLQGESAASAKLERTYLTADDNCTNNGEGA